MDRILAVHGIGNYRACAADVAKADLEANLAAALQEGLRRSDPNLLRPVDVRAVYYSDLLRQPGQQDLGDINDLDMEEARILNAWASEFGIRIEGLQGYMTMPLRMVADAAARLVGAGDDEAYRRRLAALLSNFVRDVARYLNHADRRASVRARLADSILACRPRVVIAHSLGSVVAYETFHEYAHLSVETLVTVGSPLALPGAIFDRLMPAPSKESGRAIGPTNILNWINLADIGDIVAIPRGLHRYFVGLNPEKDFEISMGFARIHGFAHYLRSASVGSVLQSLVD